MTSLKYCPRDKSHRHRPSLVNRKTSWPAGGGWGPPPVSWLSTLSSRAADRCFAERSGKSSIPANVDLPSFGSQPFYRQDSLQLSIWSFYRAFVISLFVDCLSAIKTLRRRITKTAVCLARKKSRLLILLHRNFLYFISNIVRCHHEGDAQMVMTCNEVIFI